MEFFSSLELNSHTQKFTCKLLVLFKTKYFFCGFTRLQPSNLMKIENMVDISVINFE